tara:strand:- start:90 stop:977 length:888 start_codon:yes stop_codon:yes gene_type:complete
MPRVGSREWNRQQNLRRQREQEQVVEATIVIQQAEQVVVEAEPLECRRDIQQLREQIQNKIHQIEQLKTNTKELKKLNKALNTENRKMGEEIMKLNKVNENAVETGAYILKDLDNYGYLNDDKEIDYNFDFRMTSIDAKKLNEKEKSIFEEWKQKGNSGVALSFTLNDGNSQNKKIVQEYIRYLETLVLSNTNTMESVSKGFNFKTYMLKYKGNDDKFRSDISDSEGNKSDRIDYPVCVFCKDMCDNEYGNNPSPVLSKGKCCDNCNEGIVIPARMGMIEVETKDFGFVIKKKKK